MSDELLQLIIVAAFGALCFGCGCLTAFAAAPLFVAFVCSDLQRVAGHLDAPQGVATKGRARCACAEPSCQNHALKKLSAG